MAAARSRRCFATTPSSPSNSPGPTCCDRHWCDCGHRGDHRHVLRRGRSLNGERCIGRPIPRGGTTVCVAVVCSSRHSTGSVLGGATPAALTTKAPQCRRVPLPRLRRSWRARRMRLGMRARRVTEISYRPRAGTPRRRGDHALRWGALGVGWPRGPLGGMGPAASRWGVPPLHMGTKHATTSLRVSHPECESLVNRGEARRRDLGRITGESVATGQLDRFVRDPVTRPRSWKRSPFAGVTRASSRAQREGSMSRRVAARVTIERRPRQLASHMSRR